MSDSAPSKTPEEINHLGIAKTPMALALFCVVSPKDSESKDPKEFEYECTGSDTYSSPSALSASTSKAGQAIHIRDNLRTIINEQPGAWKAILEEMENHAKEKLGCEHVMIFSLTVAEPVFIGVRQVPGRCFKMGVIPVEHPHKFFFWPSISSNTATSGNVQEPSRLIRSILLPEEITKPDDADLSGVIERSKCKQSYRSLENLAERLGQVKNARPDSDSLVLLRWDVVPETAAHGAELKDSADGPKISKKPAEPLRNLELVPSGNFKPCRIIYVFPPATYCAGPGCGADLQDKCPTWEPQVEEKSSNDFTLHPIPWTKKLPVTSLDDERILRLKVSNLCTLQASRLENFKAMRDVSLTACHQKSYEEAYKYAEALEQKHNNSIVLEQVLVLNEACGELHFKVDKHVVHGLWKKPKWHCAERPDCLNRLHLFTIMLQFVDVSPLVTSSPEMEMPRV